MDKLQELLGQYFDAGVAEGREGRAHDTEEGTAQHKYLEILECVKEMVSAETAACAKLMDLKMADILLLAGEMSAQEQRTVKAILANRGVVIRNRAPSTGLAENANLVRKPQ
jgi:hypothetical protein